MYIFCSYFSLSLKRSLRKPEIIILLFYVHYENKLKNNSYLSERWLSACGGLFIKFFSYQRNAVLIRYFYTVETMTGNVEFCNESCGK